MVCLFPQPANAVILYQMIFILANRRPPNPSRNVLYFRLF
jgi:hypothetical protein